MAKIQSNEREFSGQVIAWLNEFISGGSYPFDTATGETSVQAVRETTKFPDAEIWLNRASKQGFCGWELKPPSIPADDPTLLENAAAKARTMNADHFVTWNMRNAILWRTPQAGTLVSASDRVKEYTPIPHISTPEDMWVKPNDILLKERAREILDDLKTLHYEGNLGQIETDTTFFVARLRKSIDALFPAFRDSLLEKISSDSKFKRDLQAWGTKQGIANVTDAEFHQTVARQTIYRLLVRILFYFTLQSHWRSLPELSINGLSGQAASAHLKEIFAQARDKDWHAVFEEGLPDEIDLPDIAAYEINSLLRDLKRFRFNSMPHDVIGAVFEQLIPQRERHTLGQYFTPENLVDLVLSFCVRQREDKVLDPTCGTGTFLLRAYNKKMREFGLVDHKQLLPQIWGIDIAHFPAELATINLFRQDLTDYANFPRIVVKDFFDVKPGDAFDFPPPKANLSSGFSKVEEAIPQFDAAVGNFPFIRQELIEKTNPKYKDKLEKVIKDDWRDDYRDAFALKVSGQADIYTYLFFHTGRFVREGGRMGFITSNSWLDVAYGYELQKYMVNNFKIVAILESRCEPWFEDAAVNTVVTILERCSDQTERDDNIVKFVKVKKKLAELMPWDAKLDAINRWVGLDAIAQKVEDAGIDYLKIEGTKVTNALKGVETSEDADFRIRLVRQGELRSKLNAESKTAKWGHYLRTPHAYIEALEHSKIGLPELSEIADVSRGITTNNVDFFYLTEDTINHWRIENEFIRRPVIYTPKEIPDIAVDASKLSYALFVCNKTKKELVGTKALAYIKYGETKGFNNSLTFKGREQWYSLGNVPNEPCSLFYARQGSKFRVALNSDGVIANDNLYTIVPKNHVTNELLCALLNSFLFALGLEVNGRINLGEGALKVQAFELGLTQLPNPNKISTADRKAILSAFKRLESRPIKSIFEEVKMKDRQKLDNLVLQAMGLDPEKYLKPIYDGLTELVRERTELAGMRKKLKKAKPVRDITKLTEQVLKDLVQEGIKKFPADFLSKKLKPQECSNVPVPDVPLRLGGYFFGNQEVVGYGFSYQARSLAAAKYIIYAHKAAEYIISLPNDEIVVTKAVTEYEHYLKELFQKLNKDILGRTFDQKQAETLSRHIFQELGLPADTGAK